MLFKVVLKKDKKYWVVECKELGIISQGKTKSEALFMIQDALNELAKAEFELKINVSNVVESDRDILLNVNDLFAPAILLKQQRFENGLTQAEIAKRLKVKVNAYAQYEQAKRIPSTKKFNEIIHAITGKAIQISFKKSA